MSDRFSDPNWWPQPPPKPLKAPSAAKLVFGTLVPALAVVGAFVAMSGFGHSGHTNAEAEAQLTVAAGAADQDRRQAFAECMKSMGAGSGFRGGGRFGGGGGPSKSFRNALDVCRSLLQSGQPAPGAPQRTGTTAAPVA